MAAVNVANLIGGLLEPGFLVALELDHVACQHAFEAYATRIDQIYGDSLVSLDQVRKHTRTSSCVCFLQPCLPQHLSGVARSEFLQALCPSFLWAACKEARPYLKSSMRGFKGIVLVNSLEEGGNSCIILDHDKKCSGKHYFGKQD